MAPHKRKASEELTRNSVAVLEPVSVRQNLEKICWAGLSYLWMGCVLIYTNLIYGSAEVRADTHVQSEKPRPDGSTAIKRQKTTMSEEHPYQSPVREPVKIPGEWVRQNLYTNPPTNPYSKGRALDIRMDLSEEEDKKRIEDFFTPRPTHILFQKLSLKESMRKDSTRKESMSKDKKLHRVEEPLPGLDRGSSAESESIKTPGSISPVESSIRTSNRQLHSQRAIVPSWRQKNDPPTTITPRSQSKTTPKTTDEPQPEKGTTTTDTSQLETGTTTTTTKIQHEIDPTTVDKLKLEDKTSTEKGKVTKQRKVTEKLDREFLLSEEKENEGVVHLRPSTLKAFKREVEAKERKRKEKEVAILAAQQARLTRRNPLKALVQPLNPEWEEKVGSCLRLEPGKSYGTQAVTTSIGGTEIMVKDFGKLLGAGEWLNDETINAYIEWIVDAANKAATVEDKALGKPISRVPKFIAHNSYFYDGLMKKGPESTQGVMRRKKAAGTSLLEVDTVFVPICSKYHWTVGVVRPVAKTIEYFDSLGGGSAEVEFYMRKWLRYQLGKDYVEAKWTVPQTGCAIQNNGYDCGVFVCTNALCVAMGLDTSCYKEKDMILQRKNIAAVLINKGFVEEFAWGKGGV